MAFTIQEFRGKALTKAGARANLFEVKLLETPQIAGLDKDEFRFACKAAAIPPMTIGTIDVPYFGRVVKVPGNKTFENWTVTIINDEGFAIRNGFERWVAQMSTHVGNKMTTTPTALYGDATVKQYGKTASDTAIAEYKFKNIFPVSVSEITLGWGENDTIEEFTVEFAYDYWTHTGVAVT